MTDTEQQATPEESSGVAQIIATIRPILEQLHKAPDIVPISAARSTVELKQASDKEIAELVADGEGQMAALLSQFTILGYLIATRGAYDSLGRGKQWTINVIEVAIQIGRIMHGVHDLHLRAEQKPH